MCLEGVWGARDSPAYAYRVGPLKKDLTRAGTVSDDLCDRVGPLERTSRVCGEGREGGGSFVRILRVLEALGGLFLRILRVREAPGGPHSYQPKTPGGSAKETLTRVG